MAPRYWSLLLLLAPQASPAPAPPAATLNKYCVACHSPRSKAANVVVNPAELDSAALSPDVWEKVVRKLRARYMPPAGVPRPDEAAYEALIAALESKLDSAPPNPGRTDTFRRLNRSEYRNAVRDLLDLDIDVSSLLPNDESSHGFDNITVGTLSPTLLERYLSAARKISRLAIGSPIRAPGGDTFQLPPDLTQEAHFDNLPIGTRGGLSVRYTFPVNAHYEIHVRLARDRNEHIEGLTGPHEVELLLDGRPVRRFTVTPPPTGADHHTTDKHLQLRIPVTAGPHTLAATFPKRASTLLETERQPYQAHFNMDRHPRIQPAIYSLTVNGPYDPQGPGDTPSRRRIFQCSAQDEPCAQRILLNLARRAYRRPVTPSDIGAPLRFFRETAQKEGFEQGIEMALRAILVSPEFLFRVEQDPPGVAPNTAYRLNDLQLASRLSFFLWSSIPDDELLDLAAGNQLHHPATLEKQVRRMLADPRSRALISNFAGQWLYLRNLDSATPDMRAFPDFDDNLRQAFRRETELFFESIVREDRSVLDLLRADYTFVNERLARHYGIPNVYGSRFRRVTFPARGGLFRQGSILTVTSYATRTSPVMRGAWILTNILGMPPPPPPPNVPALKDSNALSQTLSMRERMAQHRANPACAGCHQLMDPLGFALENYDAVGRYRTAEDAIPIDPSGNLPDGSRFDGVSGLQKALLSRPEVFLSTFTGKLLTYALGRGVEPHDAPAVRKMISEARSRDFRFSSFILGIAGSTPFQMRRSQ